MLFMNQNNKSRGCNGSVENTGSEVGINFIGKIIGLSFRRSNELLEG